MRPHNGKEKLGHKAGRAKLRSSGSVTSKKKTDIDKPRLKKREKQVLDLDDLAEKQAELVENLIEIDEEEEGQIKSDRFAKEFKKLRKKVGSENEHFNADNSHIEMLRAMQSMLIDIIPLAEQVFRKSKKESSAYALNALLNQAREISTDLKMSKDFDGQANFIKEMILNPVFKVFAQHLIAENIYLKNEIDTHVSNRKEAKRIKEAVDKMARSLGRFLTESVIKIHEDVDNYLAGNMNKLIAPPKKSRRDTRG